MLFNFYEVVKVTSNPSDDISEVADQEGVVLGRAEEGDCCVYAISFPNGDTWQIEEYDLESTGKFSSKEEIYSGESVKIAVDPETGEGYVKEKSSLNNIATFNEMEKTAREITRNRLIEVLSPNQIENITYTTIGDDENRTYVLYLLKPESGDLHEIAKTQINLLTGQATVKITPNDL